MVAQPFFSLTNVTTIIRIRCIYINAIVMGPDFAFLALNPVFFKSFAAYDAFGLFFSVLRMTLNIFLCFQRLFSAFTLGISFFYCLSSSVFLLLLFYMVKML
ncbi:unnamed protein product [Chrysodeixis includens]|uniref:Uncharacterized protein n=1 Tax=Chrysodeixis includens TaxID=689277 RepID=A0A9N8L514_CHRIL|nr:unnamed protein product [Chrysodeixis includens]